VNYKQDNWEEILPAAEFSYNNSLQGSTGYTPFQLDNGHHPRTPLSLTNEKKNTTNVKAAQELLEHWTEMMNVAKDSLVNAQEKQSDQANKKRRYLELDEGDLVLLNTANLTPQENRKRPSKKLTSKFMGPFKIIKKISTTAYRLELPETLRIHPVFHISLLKPYYPNEDNEATETIQNITNETPEEQEVEAILDKRTYYRRLQYLVKWKGHPLHDATWEPLKNLENYKDLVKEFEKGGETVLNGGECKGIIEPRGTMHV